MSTQNHDRDVILQLFESLKAIFQDELAENGLGGRYEITFFNPDTAKAAELPDALISDHDGKHRVRIRLVTTPNSANASEVTPLANYFVTVQRADFEDSFDVTGIGDVLSTRRGSAGTVLDMARRLVDCCRPSKQPESF